MKDIKAVYFIGAGGIGMSAIARYFISRGLVVAGYDKTPSDLTRQLEKEGYTMRRTSTRYQKPASSLPPVSLSTPQPFPLTIKNCNISDRTVLRYRNGHRC